MSITMLASTAGIALTCAAFILHQFSSSRAGALDQAGTLARIIATNSTAALAFDNVADAEQVLGSLRTEANIVGAALYDAEGRLFARYGSEQSGAYPAAIRIAGRAFHEDYLEQIVEVRERPDRNLGFLYLRADLGPIYDRMWLYAKIAAVIVGLSLIATYFLARLLQQRISTPLRALVDTASAISDRGDFSVRAPPAEEREFKLLTHAFNDMLDRIDAQRTALLESERRLRAALDSALSAVIVMNAHGVIVEWNPHAEGIFGWSRSEAVGRNLADTIIPERSRDFHHQGLQRFFETGQGPLLNRTVEVSALRRDGTQFPAEVAITVLHDQQPLSFCGFVTDITERKQARSRLQTQLARLDLLQRTTRAIGERQDLDSIFQVILRNLEDNMPIDFGCVALHDASARALTLRTVGTRSKVLWQNADVFESSLPSEDGLRRCLEGVLLYEPDITTAAHPLLRQLAGVGLHSLVAAPMMVEKRVFGVLIVARSRPCAFSSPDCEFMQQLSEHVALAAHQIRLYDDLQRAYDDLRLSQQTVLQQERLRALGQMASGVAHDINNAISPVTLYTESLLEREPGLSDRAREYLRIIQRAIGDVGHTVARMREFYRQRDQVELLPVQLNTLIEQVLDLTRARWSDIPQERGIVIDVRTEPAADLPKIAGIESDLRDALTNLIFNAVDAMPEGGTLRLRTRLCPDHSRSPSAPLVELEIADSGIGMDEATRGRCLEPFFTTKGERGSGMGLAMVYGMAVRHDAQLEIDSAPGAGTTIRLRFAAALESVPTATYASHSTAPARRLRLLVVDDDPLLSEALLRILESEGHEVTVAEGGRQGIDLFEQAHEAEREFDLVVTDLGMPYVDGRAVAAAVKRTSPHTPVVLLTGWGQRLNTERSVPEHVDVLLGKPPRIAELRRVLSELTARSRATVLD